MAQLKNTLITGNARITGTLFSDIVDLNLLKINNTLGTTGQIIKVNAAGTGIEWSSSAALTQTYSTTDALYPLLMSGTVVDETNVSDRNSTSILNNNLYANPNTGHLYANAVHNAIWNDYAEYRHTINAQPGQVVIDNDDGTLSLTKTRLQAGAQVISDTWGHIMGETAEAKTPIAVAGRVLAYTHQPRENYHAGMAVCSAPNGTIDIMTREEIQNYPDCIVGIVSEIPSYEYWGSGNIKIDGRIWIRVK